MGTTPRQMERQRAALNRPVRTALILSAGYFVLMWAFTGFSLQPVVLILWILGSLGFGFGLVWFMRRRAERTDEEQA
jgi:Flp pilus assembly protein TadB